jgi:hypothetical protein
VCPLMRCATRSRRVLCASCSVCRSARSGSHFALHGRAGLGTVVLPGTHAGVDFDWSYPVLLVLLIAGGAVLAAQNAPTTGPTVSSWYPPTVPATVGLLVLGLLVAVPCGHSRLRRPSPPCAEETRTRQTGPISRAAIWNSGAPALVPVSAVVVHAAGRGGVDMLLASVTSRRFVGHGDRLLVAERLAFAGQHDAALDLIAGIRASLDERRAWGVAAAATQAVALELSIVEGSMVVTPPKRCSGCGCLGYGNTAWTSTGSSSL